MKRMVTAAEAVLVLSLACAAHAQPATPPKPLSVARIVSSISEGQPWGEIRYSIGCITPYERLAWGTGRGRLNVRAFEQPARAELKSEGFTVSGDLANPFGQDISADLAVGGTITAIKADFCIGLTSQSASNLMGSASMEVDWQVYSTIERRVLATVHTKGAAQSTTPRAGGFETLLIGALDNSLKGLTA